MRAYWQPNEIEQERVRYETLIVRDLAQFSDWVVVSAITEWRRTMSKRPTPADLIAMCKRYRQNAVVQKNSRSSRCGPDPESHTGGHSSATSEERKASFRRIADAVGFVEHNGDWISQDYFSDLKAEEEAPRVPHWTERDDTRELWRSHLERARASNPLMFPAKPVAD